jgi:hypothetical protein
MLRCLCGTSILLPINLSTRLGVAGIGLEHLERLVVGHIRELDQVRTALHRARYETAPQAVVSKRGRVEAGPTAAPALTMLATLAFGHHEDRMPMHGYEPTHEDAMAAFGKTWRRNDPH